MVELRQVTKYYGSFPALNNLSLQIEKGELFGFVGPNGAGKTTSMKVMAGLLACDEGSLLIEGEKVEPEDDAWKEKIGYMPDFFGVYDNLKVMEYMEFYASICGKENERQYLRELLDRVGLSGREKSYVDSLSRGMKQKLCLARTLIHNPQILILDEPASGMEPRARYELKEILRQLSIDGKTVIVSSHILADLAQMCTSIGIIERGSMILKGTVEEIMTRFNESAPLVMNFIEGQEAGMRILKEDPGTRNIASRGSNVSVLFQGGAKEEAELLARLISGGVRISEYRRAEGSLEALFLKLTDKGDEDAER